LVHSRACLRLWPGIDLYGAEGAGELSRAQVIYAEFKSLLEFVVAGGLATAAVGGLGLLGLRAGDPSRPLPPLDEEGRAALKNLPADA
jgi:4-hydroxy-tetrahydrodipicolinate synthase